MQNPYAKYVQPSVPGIVQLPPDPMEVRREARADQREDRAEGSAALAAAAAARAARNEGRAIQNDAENRRDKGVDRVLKLRDDFNGDKTVQEYTVGIRQLGAAIKRAPDSAGDIALIYDFAKAMDPGSVVREAEMGMAEGTSPAIETLAAKARKQFGMDGGGNLTPEGRKRLIREIGTKVTAMNKAYTSIRSRYEKDAQAFGMDPERIIGPHAGDAFMPQIKEYQSRQAQSGAAAPNKEKSAAIDAMIRAGVPYEQANAFATMDGGSPLDPDLYKRNVTFAKGNPNYKGSLANAKTIPSSGDYRDSALGQGLSGFNEGLASTLGAPVDLMTGAINLIPKGINALANTDLPTIERPFLGSEQIKDAMSGWSIYDQTQDPTKQVVRRTAQSLGATAIPAAGTAGSLRGLAAQAIPALTGGLGASAAQQLAPGNPLAEAGGEIVGSLAGGLGMFGNARRLAQRKIEQAVPTVDQLKQQAGNLYRQAEARGVVAGPQQTQQLAGDFRQTLTDEGLISPTGRLSEVHPKVKEAYQLVNDYAGTPMNPTQIQTVRKVVGDALTSTEPAERRLGGMLTEGLDSWSMPLAPELREARDISSRYLTAQQLEQARELAGSKAQQFTGSGFENALRTEYRGLDRAAIKGQERFTDDVTAAIENVSRGTPGSNFARNIGRLAPTGPVSMMGSMVPAMAAGSAYGTPVGGVVGGMFAGAGVLGRAAATKMGIRNADIAELTARNGGALPQSPLWDPDLAKLWAFSSAGQASQYSRR